MRIVPSRRGSVSLLATLVLVGALLGLAATPALAISVGVTSVDFGPVRIGSTKIIDVPVTVSADFHFEATTYVPTDGFILEFGSCQGVVGLANCEVELTFHPTAVGVNTPWFQLQECPIAAGPCNPFSAQIPVSTEGVNNAAPVCQDVSATIRPVGTDLDLSCTDGDPITYSVATPPQHGIATVTPSTGAVHYTPDPGYTGSDSFTYQADDGIAYPASNVATVNLRPRSDHTPSSPTQRFSLALSRVGMGRIVSDPAGIDCGASCTGDFDEATQITLTAKAHAGWMFKRWRYGCHGQGKVCTIDMVSNRRAVAVFVALPIACGVRKTEHALNC